MTTIPPIPAGGADIASEWGIDVHNRTYEPLSCQVSGGYVVGTAFVTLPIDAFEGGYDMADLAGNQLIIPPGGGGLYLATAAIHINSLSLGKVARAGLVINGAATNDGCELMGMGGSTGTQVITGVVYLDDGASIRVSVTPEATEAGQQYKIAKFLITRIGNSLGGVLSPA